MMSSERPAKRIRQACESCRRKKTRCPGEKPVCSYCARLGQSCFYANESQNLTLDGVLGTEGSRIWEERFQSLESKLEEVLNHQKVGSSQHTDQTTSSQVIAPRYQSIAGSDSTLPSWEIVVEAAELYLIYCDCQPFPLFHRATFISSLAAREPEILFAILALASRFSSDPQHRQNYIDNSTKYIEEARKLVMGRVTDGQIELSTLQTLCLLSQVDFSCGNTHRASIHCSLALSLAHCAGLTCESQKHLDEKAQEERRRCFWSLFLLKRLHGAEFSILDFSGEENFPWYPASPGRPTSLATIEQERLSLEVDEGTKDAGILAYSVQLSEVWFKLTKYARRRGNPSPLPPWSPKSDYAVIMAQQMEFETRSPNIHRFRPVGFSKRSPEELQKDRDYWGPWLFVQFLYHTNLCLLNHPLLMSLRLRTLRSSTIPEIFLQSTADLVVTHEKWIVHLIDLLEAKSYKVSDPFLAHCAAIVATIFLQETFEKDATIRKEKRDNFTKCLKFIEGFREWPHVARIAEKLKQLETTVSETYHISGNPQTPNRGLLIDLGRFWEVLEYAAASEISSLSGTIFGSSLYSTRNRHLISEYSETSALPETTRVGNLTSSSAEENNVVARSEQGVGMGFGNVVAGRLGPSVEGTPMAYSTDELAVLAESFFNQDFHVGGDVGGVDDWWNTGNL